MKSITTETTWKLNRIEVLFFITIFLIFPILTDIEVYFYEPVSSNFYTSLLERIMYGVLRMLPYLVYYKIIIPFLFESRYLIFTLLIAIFLLFLTIYTKYEHWFISKLTFLPNELAKSAEKWFNHRPKLFPFSVVFVFREMLMFTALAYFVRSSEQDLQIQDLRQKQLESELNYLKIQIQPHFFFNTLNNIYSLALQKSDQTAPLISKHADMMRYILYHSKKPRVIISQEIAFLRNYVEVESLRYSSDMDIRFDIQGINDKVAIEPFLLLPFVENAFKHGLTEETKNGFVHIIICQIEHELIVEVRNSKPFNYLSSDHNKGIGLKNVIDRLEILYPYHKLVVREGIESYEVNLTLPLVHHV